MASQPFTEKVSERGIDQVLAITFDGPWLSNFPNHRDRFVAMSDAGSVV
jgi:hypothetical protein